MENDEFVPEGDCNSPERCRARIIDARIGYATGDLSEETLNAIVENRGRVPHPHSVAKAFSTPVE